MKELNEYKQEIFRRSEEKKRQIRKRRRIALGVGIPLCLCAVLTVAALPYLSFMGMKATFAPSKNIACDSEMEESPVKSFRVTDPVDVAMVLSVLEGEEPEYSLNQDTADKEHTQAAQAEPEQYLLTVCLPDGGTVCYRIQNQQAYCVTTGETRWLSETQISDLRAFLTQISD